MTIKWVQVDPLVMNGEPFCYGSRLTVRQLREWEARAARCVICPKPDEESWEDTEIDVRRSVL